MARAINVFHLAGDRIEALHWLEMALNAGYGLAEFERDPDLKPLRDDAGYRRVIERFTAGPSGQSNSPQPQGGQGRNNERGACT